MGTNFYLRRKLSQDEKQYIINCINNDDWSEVRGCLPEDVHIGKRSGGWKFLWDAHFFRYYKPNKQALFDWLKSGQIIDEYGNEFTFKEFWNTEIRHFLYDGYDIESYYDDNPDEYRLYASMNDISDFTVICPECKNIINKYGEFYIEDLRFTISEDFS